MQPLAAITLMQSFPLHVVNNDRSRLAFANGQYILIERSAYEAAGGHRAVRERFVEDIGMAEKVKALGLPIRVALVRGLVLVPDVFLIPPARSRLEPHPLRCTRTQNLAARAQAARSDHLLPERPPGAGRGLDSHGAGSRRPFATWLLILALIHHGLMFLLFLRVYTFSVPGSRYFAWFPLAKPGRGFDPGPRHPMCVTGNVTWRGTAYQKAGRDDQLALSEEVADGQSQAPHAR